MFIEPVVIEQVYHVLEKKEEKLLKRHFECFYNVLLEHPLIPTAVFDSTCGIHRCLSGIPHPYHNALFGVPHTLNWDHCIQEQLQFFKAQNTPFVWYVDENANPAFKEKLLKFGFSNEGSLHGVFKVLDRGIPDPVIPENYTLELVQDKASLKEFNALVCHTLDIREPKFYLEILEQATQTDPPKMYHWVARKEGKIVATLTTMIKGDFVSFWNGSTLPKERRHGISTALRQMALNHALSKGCHFGASYLMAEGMALGLCHKLGFETRWRFHAYASP